MTYAREIPAPISVYTVERWKNSGFTGYREFTTTISIGDVVLLERVADDEEDEDYTLSGYSHQEETITVFAERLKEVLGL